MIYLLSSLNSRKTILCICQGWRLMKSKQCEICSNLIFHEGALLTNSMEKVYLSGKAYPCSPRIQLWDDSLDRLISLFGNKDPLTNKPFIKQNVFLIYQNIFCYYLNFYWPTSNIIQKYDLFFFTIKHFSD
jgi:hypothetical protein